MEYENMRVTELKALARDHGLRNYSRMRKAELVALLQNNPPPAPQMSAWEPIDDRRLRKLRIARSRVQLPGGVQVPAPACLVHKKWIYLSNRR